jgi:hypothetical protein
LRPNGVFVLPSVTRDLLLTKPVSRDRFQFGPQDHCQIVRLGNAVPAPQAAAPAFAGPSRVDDGLAFRCKDNALLIVKSCLNGPSGICNYRTQREGDKAPMGMIPMAARNELDGRMQGCELGTVQIALDMVVTFKLGR